MSIKETIGEINLNTHDTLSWHHLCNNDKQRILTLPTEEAGLIVEMSWFTFAFTIATTDGVFITSEGAVGIIVAHGANNWNGRKNE